MLPTANARGSVERQAADIEGLSTRGAVVLLVLAHEPNAVVAAVKPALAEAAPVIAHGRQIKDLDVICIGVGPVLVGEAQACVRLNLADGSRLDRTHGDAPPVAS
ncbi:hypothetical protein [Marivita sp.]|uniref:hypothetical protein n=1 Tax=Marivita sp. TaxID=2003365 RepID=UPI003F72E8F0